MNSVLRSSTFKPHFSTTGCTKNVTKDVGPLLPELKDGFQLVLRKMGLEYVFKDEKMSKLNVVL